MRLRSDSTARVRRFRSRKTFSSGGPTCRAICSSRRRSPVENLRRGGCGLISRTRPAGRPAGLHRHGQQGARPEFLAGRCRRVERARFSEPGSTAASAGPSRNPRHARSCNSQPIEISKQSNKNVSDRACGTRLRSARGSVSPGRTLQTKTRSSSSSRIARQACSHWKARSQLAQQLPNRFGRARGRIAGGR